MNKQIFINTSSFSHQHKQLNALKQANFLLTFNKYGRRLTESELLSQVSDKVIAVLAGLEPLNENVLKNSKNLKVISRCGIAMENVDLTYAKQNNIQVYNTPDAPSLAVAELTIGLMLACLRRICEADRALKKKKWQPLIGSLLHNKQIGIIGYGRVGAKVAALVNAFGAKVMAYDTQTQQFAHNTIQATHFNDIIDKADIITLHAPHNAQTHHLINQKTIGLMKPEAIIINTARGELIDHRALYQALSEKRIQGAGLDVYEQEPYAGELCKLDNVVMTAHMGSYAKESRFTMESEALDNLILGLKNVGLM